MEELATATETLKHEVANFLRLQGYVVTNNTFHLPSLDKAGIRNIHAIPRAERINEHIDFIEAFAPIAKQYMLDNNELKIAKVKPTLIEVQADSIYSDLFRWWNLTWWSLPYEKAYGRQMRFIVWDNYHGAPIGLIGLQSPILSWNVRDKHLGITMDMRDFWVNQSMNAQRLGALPPYNKFLGGKLVASLMASDTVRESFHKKYEGYETLLMKRSIPANLLFITTTGAYGKSSVYNRLRFKDSNICDFIGYTDGSGSFHISNTLYEGFVNYLRGKRIKAGRSFGNGPSVKMKIINRAMGLLGYRNGTGHGVKRAVYLFPFVRNLEDVIQHGKKPDWQERCVEDLTKYWKKRWAIKRINDYPQENLRFSKEEFLIELEQDLENCKKLVIENLS